MSCSSDVHAPTEDRGLRSSWTFGIRSGGRFHIITLSLYAGGALDWPACAGLAGVVVWMLLGGAGELLDLRHLAERCIYFGQVRVGGTICGASLVAR